MTHNLKHRCSAACSKVDVHLASLSEQRDISSRIIDEAAVEHGFVMFGDCMFHPDEWLGSEQEHDTVGNFLAQRLRMAEEDRRKHALTRSNGF
jgi:hypothetical protein